MIEIMTPNDFLHGDEGYAECFCNEESCSCQEILSNSNERYENLHFEDLRI